MSKLTQTFANPPLTEVICGLSFKVLQAFAIPHVGLLWADFQPRYPLFRQLPPLLSVEDYSDKEAIDPLVADFDSTMLPRFWFMNESNDSVVQVQQDRFIYNWKRGTTNRQYPRFDTVYSEFEKEFAIFKEFITSTGLGEIQPNQLELTYVNTISEESSLNALIDMPKLLPNFAAGLDAKKDSELSGLRLQLSFEIPKIHANGYVDVQPTLTKDHSKFGVLLVISVKGQPKTTGLEQADWFQGAREWISETFADLTSKDIQKKYWGLQSE